MPRPPVKRRRQNSFTRKKHISIPDQIQAREAHEKKLSNKPVGKRPTDSDDSDGIVISTTSGRNRKRQEIYASGAVAKGDRPGGYPTKAQQARTMRENTKEILSQRSRSASRANSEASAKSTNAETSSSGKGDSAEKPASKAEDSTSAKKRKLDEVNPRGNGAPQISQAEVSVLGKFKPRKRQASILQLIEKDNNDSSIVNSDDEAEFLPDGASTPLIAGQKDAFSPQVRTSSSLKRKLGSDTPQTDTRPSLSLTSTVFQRQQPQDQLPPPTRSQQRKLSDTGMGQKDHDEVMALPESDSEDSSDERVVKESRPRDARARKPFAPSTEQLQNLMPSKTHKTQGKRQQPDEFEIPETSNTDEESEAENDHSAFLPSRSRRAQKRPQTKAKTSMASKKLTGKGVQTKSEIKDKSKSTRNDSYTPSPARLRTPRPIPFSKLRSTEAKSPSKQDTAMRERSANTPLTSKVSNDGKKQYGGSRLRGTGKENHVVSSLDEPSGEGGFISPQKRKKAIEDAATAEVKAWNKKWGDIDDFDLEYEENSASTRSNSPMAR